MGALFLILRVVTVLRLTVPVAGIIPKKLPLTTVAGVRLRLNVAPVIEPPVPVTDLTQTGLAGKDEYTPGLETVAPVIAPALTEVTVSRVGVVNVPPVTSKILLTAYPAPAVATVTGKLRLAPVPVPPVTETGLIGNVVYEPGVKTLTPVIAPALTEVTVTCVEVPVPPLTVKTSPTV